MSRRQLKSGCVVGRLDVVVDLSDGMVGFLDGE